MKPALHGLLAEFATSDALLAAAHAAYKEGFRVMDAYSPFPIEGLAEAIGFPKTRVPAVVLIGGIIGGAFGYAMQFYSTYDYPLNIGGRPLHSWPAFVPITFELIVLFGSLFALVGMLAMNRLPQPYHPVFNVPEFKFASQSRFFLCLQAIDPYFRLEEARRFLETCQPIAIREVEA